MNKTKIFPQNFPYGDWFKEYCLNELNDISEPISRLFDLNKVKQKLKQKSHPTTEGYWHVYTNIINLDKNIKYFTHV